MNAAPQPPTELIGTIQRFIAGHWQDTVRACPWDAGSLLSLPHPYTVPCRKGAFQELYYWDTYFTLLGLLGTGEETLALGNVRNLLAQVARYGYVPNGNRTYYLCRSQPPYLAAMVGLLDHALADEALRQEAVPLLAKEYAFWTTRRLTPTGLSRYGHHATVEELIEFFPTVRHRLGLPDACPEDHLDLAGRTMAECESGWDLTSRYDRRCPDFCPVDLNSNLWLYETLLARWTDGEESERWQIRAHRRLEWINTFCWDAERSVFCDYDMVNQRHSPTITAAAFQPLWAGLASEVQAAGVVAHVLPLLEHEAGVSAVAPCEPASPFQWDHPNGWACVQHLVYRGLERYGYLKEARRVADKYVNSVCRTYAQTGDLWEKYNVLDGSHRTTAEAGYLINPENFTAGTAQTGIETEPPAMMGWTAGVFIDAVAFLNGQSDPWLTLPHETLFPQTSERR